MLTPLLLLWPVSLAYERMADGDIDALPPGPGLGRDPDPEVKPLPDDDGPGLILPPR